MGARFVNPHCIENAAVRLILIEAQVKPVGAKSVKQTDVRGGRGQAPLASGAGSERPTVGRNRNLGTEDVVSDGEEGLGCVAVSRLVGDEAGISLERQSEGACRGDGSIRILDTYWRHDRASVGLGGDRQVWEHAVITGRHVRSEEHTSELQ